MPCAREHPFHSFVGPTGAGKSLLINFLIPPEETQRPVVAARTAVVSTSADIHLYTASLPAGTGTGSGRGESNRQPAFLLDSEGSGGSEVPRTQARRLAELRNRGVGPSVAGTGGTSGARDGVTGGGGSEADSDAAAAWIAMKRNYVASVYPRLLYLISDVIVFVFRGAPQNRQPVLREVCAVNLLLLFLRRCCSLFVVVGILDLFFYEGWSPLS